MNEDQTFLIVVSSAVLFVVLFAVVFCFICRRFKLKESFKRNKPIIVKMFSKSTECRRNAVTEETYHNRKNEDLEAPLPTPTEATDNKIFAIQEEEEEEIEAEANETNYGTLSKNLSKSLPELHHVNLHTYSINKEIPTVKIDSAKRGSVLLDPVYLEATNKRRIRKENSVIQAQRAKTTLLCQAQSLPRTVENENENEYIKVPRHNTMQNPHIYMHSLKERGIHFGDNSDDFLSASPISRFHSLHNLNYLHTELPRATSIERIPIDNAMRFKECKLTEIAPGCFSVPIVDKRKNKDTCEIKVFY